MLSEKASVGNFPITKHYLWDKTNVGQATLIHIAQYRNPKICMPEKVLRLIQHQCEHFNKTTHSLIGSFVVDGDGEGVCIQIERLDTRANVSQDAGILGEVIIPFRVTNNTSPNTPVCVDDYISALQTVQDRCCSKSSIEMSSFLQLYGWATFYSNAHTCVVHIDFDMITIETVFKATPIPAIPIALTALSKNLAGPKSLSKVQGAPKTGYLSMDNTRKIFLILESDPKATTLPLVGIWISGVEFLQHPFVWTSCLRFIHNSSLQDRVNLPPEDFLLILYSPLHSKPEFYQCNTLSGSRDLSFKLFSGHEATHIPKAFSSPCDYYVEITVEAATDQNKVEIFYAAKSKDRQQRVRTKHTSFSEDIEPRSAPIPHMEKVSMIQPVVPDVSVLWAESSVESLSSSIHGTPAPRPSVINNNTISSYGASIPRPRLSTSSTLLQQYSPTPNLPLSCNGYCPSSHTAETSTMNSHVSVTAHERFTMPSSQVNRPVQPGLAQHPCMQHFASHGDLAIVAQQNYSFLPQTAERRELVHTDLNTPTSHPHAYKVASISNPILQQVSSQTKTTAPVESNDQGHSPIVNRNRCVHPLSLKTVVEESVISSDQHKLLGHSTSDSSTSEDSGLSTTPDKNMIQEKLGPVSTGNANSEQFAWDQLPADIRTLLIQQNEQIRLLQQQIHILLQQQANQNTQMSSVQNPLMVNPNDNTSQKEELNEQQPGSSSLQNSMTSANSLQGSNIVNSTQDKLRGVNSTPQKIELLSYNTLQGQEKLQKTLQKENKLKNLSLDSDLPLLSSKEITVQRLNERPDISTKKLISSSDILIGSDLNSSGQGHRQIIQPALSDVVVSEIISSSQERSPLNQSPVSFSQYSCNDQDESYSTLAEDASDPKQYYDQLMANIQRFLSNTGCTETETIADKTTGQINTMNDVSLAQQVSCMSLLLGCGADVGQSMEINAMAMKYLNDEQLTQMARLWKEKSYSTNQSDRVLQKLFSGSQDTSLWSSSPNMTMGTQMYLARHGLLGSHESTMFASSSHNDQTSLLKTDFSTLTVGSPGSNKMFAYSDTSCHVDTGIKGYVTPHLDNSSRSTVISRSTNYLASNDKRLPAHARSGPLPLCPSLGLAEKTDTGTKNALQAVRLQETSRKKLLASPALDEEENLLDIAKLKQLPKLL